ncbi:MAG: FAD-dependent oxidoreductase, partial [Chloroflexota bacterium]
VGDYVLAGDDVRQGRRFDDAVALGAWRLDRHRSGEVGYHEQPVVPPYDIPYRTLLPQGLENLLVAGRCHSATSEALASSRVTATAMAMGEAAGAAAAMAARSNAGVRDVDVSSLQDRLLAGGAILDPAAAAAAQ